MTDPSGRAHRQAKSATRTHLWAIRRRWDFGGQAAFSRPAEGGPTAWAGARSTGPAPDLVVQMASSCHASQEPAPVAPTEEPVMVYSEP